MIERNRDLLKRGAVLVDETDMGQEVRTLVYLEHAIQDARMDRTGNRRMVSKQMQFVEIDNQGSTTAAGYAPYLNYRPLNPDELPLLPQLPEPTWLREELESKVLEYAALNLVPSHLDEVRRHKETLVDKTKAAVQERLAKEINYWDHRAVQLKEQELAGKVNAKLNSGLARQRADELAARLQKRLVELDQERRVSPLPPVVLGAALVVPLGLLARLRGDTTAPPPDFAADTKRSELLAMCCRHGHRAAIGLHSQGRERPETRIRCGILDPEHREAAVHRGEGAHRRGEDRDDHQRRNPHRLE